MLTLTLAWRYLAGRKLRSTLTTLAVVFGVFILFAMNIILPTFLAAFQANAMAASNQVDLTVSLATGGTFDPAVLDTIANTQGVRAATGLLSRPVNLPLDFYDNDPQTTDTVSTLTLVGVDLGPEHSVTTLRNTQVTSGRYLEAGDTTQAIISAGLADALGLRLGGTLRLPSTNGVTDLQIVGLLPGSAATGNEQVLVTLAEAQSLLDLPDRLNVVEANYAATDAAARTATTARVQAALGDDYVAGALSDDTDLIASIKVGQAAMSMFGVAALIMGGFIIFNTFRTVVAERRRDIGMLRAVGAGRRTIIGLILAEGLLQGLIGTAVGMGLGYLAGVGLLGLFAGMLQTFVHLQIGAPVVQPALVVTTILLGVGVTLLAGLLPAISATRVTPLDALRPAPAEVEQRAVGRGAVIGGALLLAALLALISGNTGLAGLGALLLLAGLVLVGPALVRPVAGVFSVLISALYAREGTGRLALGNLSRQPTRAAITASTTLIALALIVAVAGMLTSFEVGFLSVLRATLGSDYLLIPPAIAVWSNDVGAKAQLAEDISAVPGVALVSSLRFAPSAANGTPLSLLGVDPRTYPQVAQLKFDAGDPPTAFAALQSGRALIANGVLATALQLKVGEVIPLTTANGPQNYTVVGIAGDYMNAKVLTAWTSQANLAADFNSTADIFLQFDLAPGADAAAVEARVGALLEAYPQFHLVSSDAYYQENATLFKQVFAGLYVLFVVLALPSLIAILNSLAIGVIERTREIGMLRAVGATQRQVSRMIMVEALLLSALGTPLGLLGGLYLGYVLTQALSRAGYQVDYFFPYQGLLVALAIGLLCGVAAALAPARQAARLEVVRALRYE
ncbi:MAG: FtsX-like permease family protein [Anaerolineales bacterium]|nr:FtsX-like permease family protein [Anaerolineales bacterium]